MTAARRDSLGILMHGVARGHLRVWPMTTTRSSGNPFLYIAVLYIVAYITIRPAWAIDSFSVVSTVSSVSCVTEAAVNGLLKHLPVSALHAIVPPDELQQCTALGHRVAGGQRLSCHDESQLLPPLSKGAVTKYLHGRFDDQVSQNTAELRGAWYLQQLLKLAAVLTLPLTRCAVLQCSVPYSRRHLYATAATHPLQSFSSRRWSFHISAHFSTEDCITALRRLDQESYAGCFFVGIWVRTFLLHASHSEI